MTTAPAVDLDAITLDSGSHKSFEDGVCLLELCAVLDGGRFDRDLDNWVFPAGFKLTDSPQCVSPFLVGFGQRLNDNLPTDRRQQLKPLAPLMLNTRNDGLDGVRQMMAVDWSVRVALPIVLGRSDDTRELAAELAALDPITTQDQAAALYGRMVRIRNDAWDRREASYKAIRAAVKAELAKRPAADAAAVAAAAAAADAAAVAAPYSDRWSAAYNAAKPIFRQAIETGCAELLDELRTSSIDLFTRIIRPAAA